MSVSNEETEITNVEHPLDDKYESNGANDGVQEVKPEADDKRETVTGDRNENKDDSVSLSRTDSSKSSRSAECESLLQQSESEPLEEFDDKGKNGVALCKDKFEFTEDVTTENGYTSVIANDVIIDNNNKNEPATVKFGSWTNLGKASKSGTHHIEVSE